MSSSRPPAADRDAAARLLEHLRRQDGGQQTAPSLAMVKADAAVATGLPPERAEAALRLLASDYRSHLSVTSEGELVYEFAPGLIRRDAHTLAQRLASALAPVGAALWRLFTVGFKVWIAATLVIYTAIFAILGLALTLASDDDGPGFLFWWLLPDWGPGAQPAEEEGPPRKRFHRSVFDFVFGPPEAQPALSRRDDDRELLGYIRGRKGRITATDLVLLRGYDYRKAEEEATRLLARYDGEPEVTDDGTLIYTFRDLRRTALPTAGLRPALPPGLGPEQAPGLGPEQATPRLGPRGLGQGASELLPGHEQASGFGQARGLGQGASELLLGHEQALLPPQTESLPQRYVAEAPLTGNRPGTNMAIGVFNGFNLVASLTIGAWAALVLGLGPVGTLLLTAAPLCFSVLFFAVPALRAAVRATGQRRRRRDNARHALIRAIDKGPEAGMTEAEIIVHARDSLLQAAWMSGDMDAIKRPAIYDPLLRAELTRLLPELEADVRTEEGAASTATAVYHFPRLTEERRATAAARLAASEAERSPGEVIFSSREEGGGV